MKAPQAACKIACYLLFFSMAAANLAGADISALVLGCLALVCIGGGQLFTSQVLPPEPASKRDYRALKVLDALFLIGAWGSAATFVFAAIEGEQAYRFALSAAYLFLCRWATIQPRLAQLAEHSPGSN